MHFETVSETPRGSSLGTINMRLLGFFQGRARPLMIFKNVEKPPMVFYTFGEPPPGTLAPSSGRIFATY